MTHDEMIAVIQAAKDGKALEYKFNGEDRDPWDAWTDGAEFNFEEFDYRIAPQKPLLAWVWSESEKNWVTLNESPPFAVSHKAKRFIELTPAVKAACEAAGIVLEDQT